MLHSLLLSYDASETFRSVLESKKSQKSRNVLPRKKKKTYQFGTLKLAKAPKKGKFHHLPTSNQPFVVSFPTCPIDIQNTTKPDDGRPPKISQLNTKPAWGCTMTGWMVKPGFQGGYLKSPSDFTKLSHEQKNLDDEMFRLCRGWNPTQWKWVSIINLPL